MPDDIEAINAYKEKFGQVPMIVGLSDEMYDKAMELLAKAVELDTPFVSNTDFDRALGVDTPPDDAEI